LSADYNEKLSAKTREQNKLLQTQLDTLHDEMLKYKVKSV